MSKRYQRKTVDTWHVEVWYGQGDGWEHETTEFSRRDAKAMVKTYRENCNFPVRFRMVREPIESVVESVAIPA